MLHWITPRAALKHIGRYNHIIAVFIKYGFGEFFQRIRIWEYRNIERRLLKRRPHEFPHVSEPERLRLALQELGPTFVKLGQMLSTQSPSGTPNTPPSTLCVTRANSTSPV